MDKANDCVWIGADSLGSNGYTKAVEHQSKVFRHDIFKNVIMGSTTTFRHIDLLKYATDLFDELDLYKNTIIDHKYMVTEFIPRVIELFDGGIKSDENERGADFIVGVRNKLFRVQNDYSVLEPEAGICVVGCGEQVAMGSLLTTQKMKLPIPEKIEMALCAAEEYACGVQSPFRIINTKDEKKIVIK